MTPLIFIYTISCQFNVISIENKCIFYLKQEHYRTSDGFFVFFVCFVISHTHANFKNTFRPFHFGNAFIVKDRSFLHVDHFCIQSWEKVHVPLLISLDFAWKKGNWQSDLLKHVQIYINTCIYSIYDQRLSLYSIFNPFILSTYAFTEMTVCLVSLSCWKMKMLLIGQFLDGVAWWICIWCHWGHNSSLLTRSPTPLDEM